ncbi:uncharacterized protein EDB91DRAFT_575636 [Suillus paluster]|uniref:uncharacterized protein n=1 Tax=Suillus paluster TaxID=48578 RepID=UPI001B8753FC|nr:uncharacterized protein EDB91DRAFT_575636 [Suillus paluster]KAG1734887.1 hypothetical protein EDB91DRAFT_575636 [Suillus paluster]
MPQSVEAFTQRSTSCETPRGDKVWGGRVEDRELRDKPGELCEERPPVRYNMFLPPVPSGRAGFDTLTIVMITSNREHVFNQIPNGIGLFTTDEKRSRPCQHDDHNMDDQCECPSTSHRACRKARLRRAILPIAFPLLSVAACLSGHNLLLRSW